jgi:hypothetical protein
MTLKVELRCCSCHVITSNGVAFSKEEGKRHALVKSHAARSLPAYSAEQQHLFLILRNWHAA